MSVERRFDSASGGEGHMTGNKGHMTARRYVVSERISCITRTASRVAFFFSGNRSGGGAVYPLHIFIPRIGHEAELAREFASDGVVVIIIYSVIILGRSRVYLGDSRSSFEDHRQLVCI